MIEALETPTVRIRVMRFSAGAHPGSYGPFHHSRFGFCELPDIVHTENVAGSVCYSDRPEDVVTCLEVRDRMSVQAEPVSRTKDILDELRKEL